MPASSLSRALWPALAFAYLACFLATAHFVPEGPRERDGYYHAQVSRTLLSRGVSRSFPWTQLSSWREGYCDKELLYHVAMAPFTLLADEPIRGAQLFTTLLSLAAFGLLYWILRRHGAPAPTLFVLLLATMGGGFWVRLTMVRSHVLSISLGLLALHLLIERRHRALLILGFLYAWSYTFPFVLLMFAAPFVLGRALAGDGLDWRSPLFATVGVVAGLAIHPYTPLTLETFLTLLKIISVGATGDAALFGLGREIYAYPTRIFLWLYPLLSLSVFGLLLWGFLRRRAPKPETVGLLCVAIFWVLFSLVFSRFVEYAAPVMALTLGFVARDTYPELSFAALRGLWRGEGFGQRGYAPAGDGARSPWGARLLIAGVIALLIGIHVQSASYYLREAAPGKPPRFRGAASWIRQHIPAKEHILNLYWDEFPELYYDLPDYRFTWGIDPIFTLRHDAKRATTLEKLRRGLIPFHSETFAKTFSVRYLILSKSRDAGHGPILRKGGAVRAYADRYAVIYRL